jgi:hypothetical protein
LENVYEGIDILQKIKENNDDSANWYIEKKINDLLNRNNLDQINNVEKIPFIKKIFKKKMSVNFNEKKNKFD